MKKVIAYCRVSTDGGKQTTENQKLAIARYIESKPDWKLTTTFEDNASGAKADRKGLDNLHSYCQKHKVDILIVWKLDRLGRSTIHLLKTLATLQELQIDFCSVTEAIDTTTPSGRMLCGFLSVISQFEREIIKERVMSGLERAKANGIKLGRPRKGFDIAQALELRNQGIGYKQIAAKLGVPRTTVYRYLKSIPKTPELIPA